MADPVPPRPGFARRRDGAPAYRRGAWFPAWALLALPFVLVMIWLWPLVRRRVRWAGCALAVMVFEVVMLPVEHQAILRGHWVYNDARILGPLVWGIPVEEPLLYYLLPPILVIMVFEWFRAVAAGDLEADWKAALGRFLARRRGSIHPGVLGRELLRLAREA